MIIVGSTAILCFYHLQCVIYKIILGHYQDQEYSIASWLLLIIVAEKVQKNTPFLPCYLFRITKSAKNLSLSNHTVQVTLTDSTPITESFGVDNLNVNRLSFNNF